MNDNIIKIINRKKYLRNSTTCIKVIKHATHVWWLWNSLYYFSSIFYWWFDVILSLVFYRNFTVYYYKTALEKFANLRYNILISIYSKISINHEWQYHIKLSIENTWEIVQTVSKSSNMLRMFDDFETVFTISQVFSIDNLIRYCHSCFIENLLHIII